VYYDVNDSPRIEMYQDDLHLSENVNDKPLFYKNVRAACESGWDFSSRWMDESLSLSSIKTTQIIPLDLNCLLYHLEASIARFSDQAAIQSEYVTKSIARKEAILEVLWNEEYQCFMDYDTCICGHTQIISCAALFPLFVGIANELQAKYVSKIIEDQLLESGGLLTTNQYTKHQWDAPNGWAPLQWIGVKGLLNYGYRDLAYKIAKRWTNLNEKVFQSTGKMMEKYNVVDLTLEAGGGEYEVQDGFGWTNGVYLALKKILQENI
ncbi:MAG TPA: trehalase family glycosidase, partial [Saprospiraceae bacterium]|nr:trehalase family glycosidase [Saprospiraceae bacterium]